MVSENSGSNYIAEKPNQSMLSSQHLQVELARIDVLVQRAIRCWQLAGQDMTDAFRGLHVSDVEAIHLVKRASYSGWGQTVALPENEEQAFQKATEQLILQIRTIEDTASQQGYSTRLQGLINAFGLDGFEKDILLLCLVPAFDLRYEKIYGYLQDDITRKRPGINLALDLLCPAGFDRLAALSHFTRDASLFKHRLVERFSEPGQNKAALLSQSLLINETIVHWLLGRYEPSIEIAAYLRLMPRSPDWIYNEYPAEENISFGDLKSVQPIFIFSGPDRLAQHAAAHQLATSLQTPLLTLNLRSLSEDEPRPKQMFRAALRDARLIGAVLFVEGWDVCLREDVPEEELSANLAEHPRMIILSSQSVRQPRGLPMTRPVIWKQFPIPAYAERKKQWSHYLAHANISLPIDLSTLAGQFALTREQIREAVSLAVNRSNQQGKTLLENDLLAAARTASSSRLAGLAHKVPPRYGWDDIVLPEDQIALLKEIVATVRGRWTVLEEWGAGSKLASSHGVSILFAGPPGTGKTLAAQIIAAELGLDLYKIDLSAMVSKYIGETEKNLEHIFTEAESSNAILFFDEADALFGKRSEVRDSHDRYANVEISYLLQRMEVYDGVTILATNLRANLDEAFTRRLQFAVDFPFPEEAHRLRIWQQLFPSQMPRANLDLPLMARRYKLAGGNIRNIIVSAAYLASANRGIVTMEHLLHGTRRELQKMGRLVNEKDLTIAEGEYVH